MNVTELDSSLGTYLDNMRRAIDIRWAEFTTFFMQRKQISQNELLLDEEYSRWHQVYLIMCNNRRDQFGITYKIAHQNSHRIDQNEFSKYSSLEEARRNLYESYCMYIPCENLITPLKENFMIGLFFHANWYLNDNHMKFIRFAIEDRHKKFTLIVCDEKLMLINHVIKRLIAQTNDRTPEATIVELNKDNISNELIQVRELILNFVFDLQHRDYLNVEENAFVDLKNLERLELKFRINRVNRAIFNGLGNLKVLKLNGCNLNNIQNGSFNELKSLKQLDLSDNPNLTTLRQDMFEGLEKLTILDLKRCKISSIESDTFANFTELISLDLSFNSIQKIDESVFAKLSCLEKLNISNCNIQRIEKEAFYNLRKLAYLNLSNNSDLNGFSFNLLINVSKNLKDLNLYNCSLQQNHLIQQTDWSTEKLKTLNLGSNNFENIDIKTLWNMNNLTELNLEKCNLKFISADAFNRMNKLKKIWISGNRLTNLDQFEKSLKSTKPNIIIK